MADEPVRVVGSPARVDAVVARLLEHLPEAATSRRTGTPVVFTPLPPGSSHVVAISVAPDLDDGRSPGVVVRLEAEDPLAPPATVEAIWELATEVAGWLDGRVLDPTVEVPVASGNPVPTSGRVVARLLALLAVTARALGERDRHLADAGYDVVRAWCDGTGARSELEPDEAAVVDAEPATANPRAVADGSWASEGAVVLAWALGLAPLPPPDQLVDPGALLRAVGFPSADATIAGLAGARLRPAAELDDTRIALATVRWRLLELAAGARPVDLAALAADPDFPLDPVGLRLAGGDLAIDGLPITAAPADRVRLVSRTALERHRAATWLAEGGAYGATIVDL